MKKFLTSADHKRRGKRRNLRRLKRLKRKKGFRKKSFETAVYKAVADFSKIRLHDKRRVWTRERRHLYYNYYRRRGYRGPTQEVGIEEEFGIESDLDKFLELSQTFIDHESRHLIINLENCLWMGPSGVTLLCSLKKWGDITAEPRHNPRISSTSSKADGVNAYMDFSGFYRFVARRKDGYLATYDVGTGVPIEVEHHPATVETRQPQLRDLIARHSSLTADGVEMINDRVLTEMLINVTEHGISDKGEGWFCIAQYHPTHKTISLCIADNGIGIRLSLLTGPQAQELEREVGSKAGDAEYIKKALEPNVSGAFLADVRKGTVLKRFERGAKCGNGLKRIVDTCKELGVGFSIVSRSGCLSFNRDGTERLMKSSTRRFFAGTLYHLDIPVRI